MPTERATKLQHGFAIAALVTLAMVSSAAAAGYTWRSSSSAAITETLENRIPPPPGFRRIPAPAASFTTWLRGLPMKSAGAPVLLHTGAPKGRQDAHIAVIDIDVGTRDLQQCADAIMRLRAEWLYASGRKSEIAFNDSDGKRLRFSARAKQDYAAFRKYMDYVFAYAGTWSLERELKPVAGGRIAIGDLFIKGGFPGHAVLVTDVVEHPTTGERRFLLAQSYMPAQEIHVLKNPTSADGSPWYPEAFGTMLTTPEWSFPATALKRWP